MSAIHFGRRRLRRTAWATLVIWLFALAAGVVNACALSPAGPDREGALADISVHGPQAGVPARAGHGSHDDRGKLVGHPGNEQDSGKASCLKFCDDESSAIAKVKLPVVDLGSNLVTLVEPWNPIGAAGSAGHRPPLERSGTRGPPLVIRFLRLTL